MTSSLVNKVGQGNKSNVK